MTRRVVRTGDRVLGAEFGLVWVEREDPELEGRVVGVRRSEGVVVHKLWECSPGGTVLETRCGRTMGRPGVEFVRVWDLVKPLRPCRKCWSELGLAAARLELDWVSEYREGVERGREGRGPVGRGAEVVGTRAGLGGGASDRGRAGGGGGDGLCSDSGEGDE